MIADPYPRFLVARDQVNQGAAVLMMSVETARRLGIDESKWVFLHGQADLRERDLLERSNLGEAPAAVTAVKHALELAGLSLDDIDFFDFYSCFPIAVSNITETLGLLPDDPRGLTLTGGLPYFGGAGNNYSMHAIAEAVQRARLAPGSYGFVGANGGVMSKYSAGVYSTRPRRVPDRSASLQAEVDAWAAPVQAVAAGGWAVVETYTVVHGRDGGGPGRHRPADADRRRFIARADDAVTELLATAAEPVGHRIYVRSSEIGNRATISA